MAASGCNYSNLSIESGSDKMLGCMQRGYTVDQVRQALDSLEGSGIPYGASLMIGAPGETPETVAESLALIDSYSIPVWHLGDDRDLPVDASPANTRDRPA